MTELRWHMFDGVIKFGCILCHYKMEMKAKQTLTLSKVDRHLSYPWPKNGEAYTSQTTWVMRVNFDIR